MKPLQLDRVRVTGVKSKRQGSLHEIFVNVEIPDPDLVGDELDDAGDQIAEVTLADQDTGIVVVMFLAHLMAVTLKTSASKPSFLACQFKAVRRHASPAKLRRVVNREMKFSLQLLDQVMRERARETWAQENVESQRRADLQ